MRAVSPGGETSRSYDYIICGAGSSGSVIARRLAESSEATVLLIEAGGDNQIPSITAPGAWFTNLGTERDWGFMAAANPAINNRQMPLSMGKVLGGGSSINVMIWSRGHRNDWDYFAAVAGDNRWSYENVLGIYRTIEDWTGDPDAHRRGSGGLVHVEPVQDPNPIAPAMLAACARNGIPTFADQNGALMEGPGGAALPNVRIESGRRLNIYDTYVRSAGRLPNLTVLTQTQVRRICFRGTRAVGVEVSSNDEISSIAASKEVILSLGAINTPKVLMQSGIGAADELALHGISVVADLPGVGRNFQDHVMVAGCVWEYREPIPFHNNAAECTFFWKSDSALDTPDLQPFQIELPYVTDETRHRYSVPEHCWSLSPALVRPKSRGRVTITGPSPSDPVRIDAGTLTDADDMRALMTCLELCRDIGNSTPLAELSRREVMPGVLKGEALKDFIRDGAVTYWHQSGTARIGTDPHAVVDGTLRVHGVQGLRVADASVMPRVTTGNTMAPCVVIGEIAAAAIKAA
jgi:choline dehydrogenase